MLNRSRVFAAVVMAAGQSRRYNAANKLLVRLDGKPLVCHCLETIDGLGLSRIVVVTGFEADRLRDVIGSYDVDVVHNGQFECGMGTSLAAGIAALPEDVDAAFICLADMPRIEANVFEAMRNALLNRPCQDICAPIFEGRKGHPVLFGRRYFPDLKTLEGDQGARRVVLANHGHTQLVSVGSSSILCDCDTEKDVRTVFADRSYC